MGQTVGILGGDARFSYLARMLAVDGFSVNTWGVAGEPDEKTLDEAASAERILLPAPLTRKDGQLNSERALALDTLWPRLRPDQRIYAGAVREKERSAAAACGLMLSDYFSREALTVKNAVPTAEGALQLALERTSVTLHGTPCLVIGFGRIGKLLAHDLKALGAQVSVSARRMEDLAWIDAFGYRPLRTNRLAGVLGPFRVIFNTVPHPVLGMPLLREVDGGCLLVELSSAAGIDAQAAAELGLTYVKAGGLPGRAAPESAALALKETLYQMWEEEL